MALNRFNPLRLLATNSSSSEGEKEQVAADGAGDAVSGDRSTVDSDPTAADEQTNVGFFMPPNTLADTIWEDWLGPAEAKLGSRAPAQHVPDVRLGRNPLRIEDVKPMLKPEIERALLNLSHDADYALVPSSLGTGYPAYKFVNVDLVFEETIDIVVSSHKTRMGLYKSPQNAILAGLGSAVLEDPAILINHRAHEIGMDDVAPELAKLIVGMTHTDVANRSYGYWSVALETVPIGGRAEMDLNPAIQRAANNLTPWATAEHWAPWAVESGELDAATQIPTLAEPDRKVILPQGVNLGQHENLRTIHANVDNAYVLGFWPLDVPWINEHVRRAGAEYVDAEIHTERSPLRQVWESHTAKFGVDDPLARWERYYADHIEPALPKQ